MKDYFYLNPSMMMDLTLKFKLKGAEIKLLLAIMYCLAETNSTIFINNKENREKMKEIEFNKAPEWISSLLSSLTKKGVLKREANAVYRLPNNLFLLADQVKER